MAEKKTRKGRNLKSRLATPDDEIYNLGYVIGGLGRKRPYTPSQTTKMGLYRVILLACITVVLPFAGNATDEPVKTDQPVKTVKVKGDFRDTLRSVKFAIHGKGINIAHTVAASNMLNRTGRDFGIRENIFIDAETIEFCSARISHQLVQANHENILLCPFTISVYVLTGDPEHVYLSYRLPYITPDDGSRAAVQDMVELIESIITEATEW